MTTKRKFIQSIPNEMIDPITGLKASNETELSTLLAYHHANSSIGWSNVNLYSIPYLSDKLFASEYINCSSPFYCEYPLFSDSETVDIWGQMPADLLSFSKNENTIVLIENKIGSKFTSAGTQLIRQAKFLEKSGFKNKVLIVLTSELFLSKGWYLSEMQNVIDNVESVKVFAMKWEDIFNAIDFMYQT
ncbi:hypothetical protein PSH47_03705 [Pseudoalteromonas sp. CST5]|uniref:hypothetical protein n=1 Tax=unclassified Pseudoalteromonas TaxID=194690 RepID=UPI002359B05C|nr:MULTISPECIES: hypothetical protein [unclassified Pseudoalteromonas]MDC9511863.1 hypothetical protein [Pseudoalteromonas sp. CST1]MDC9536099.1 hypothetical protein [Pseudoalteromonas sp. CST3]MDC9540538.1 hypothetical protein [Pseudoalteromonas sp. CST2]MDC9544444.1 hypothetical protein [Pseudoalteromonas sp. CST4]MDC9548276.1 hypothetical protein [Pseudoalteromonas sp. CST5]